MRRACRIALWVVLVLSFDTSRAQSPDSISSGKTEIEMMVELSSSVEGVAELKRRFAISKRSDEKLHIASVLVSAGEKDNEYLDLLVRTAKPAIDNDEPTPVVGDQHGEVIPGKLNPKFVRWCKKRGLDPRKSAYAELYRPVSKIIDLAAAGDPRTYRLLMRGLHSDNFLVAGFSAKGLAKIQDPRAIGEMISICEKKSSTSSLVVALALVYFNDPKAQAGADRCIENKKLLNDYREDAQRRGVKGLFGY